MCVRVLWDVHGVALVNANCTTHRTAGKLVLGKSDLYLLYMQNIEKPAKPSFVVGSFHGDTPGLLTIPMIDAVAKLATNEYPECQLVIGLDANCYKKKKDKHLFVDDLSKCLEQHALCSCFGSPINKDVVTTCMARTFLQPQTNKANLAATRTMNGDVNPKVRWKEGDGRGRFAWMESIAVGWRITHTA